MQFVGFIAIVITSLYLIYAGVAMQFVSYGFAGRISVGALIPLFMGIGLMILAIVNAPFAITFN